MRIAILIPTLLALAPLTMSAQDDGAELLGEKPATEAPAEAAPDESTAQRMQRAKARGLVQAAIEAQRRFNEDKTRNSNAIVDAAIAFQQAQAIFIELKDEESLSDVQANLFWCRKQMDHDAIKTYLASKGEVAAKVTAAMDQVANKEVAPEESKGYFARAEKYAKAHPEDYLQIAIRFLEVAERFSGQPEGVQANKRALDAQQKLMKAMSEANAATRETRFTRSKAVQSAGNAIPSSEQQKAATDLVRKNFAKAYLKKEQGDKRRLARKLFDEAARNKADTGVYYVILNESARLAQEGEDFECLLDAVDTLGGAFAGYDVAAEKANWLKKSGLKPVPSAIIKLIEAPTDPQANLTVGKYFCFELRRWSEGMPMLALGSDAGLAKAAEMEAAKPQTADEQAQVGDAWYDLAKKFTTTGDKYGAFARAQSWYSTAHPALAGLSKDKVATRLGEIDKALPLDPDKIDWVTITPTQWEKLKGKVIAVPGKTARLDSGIELKAGEKVRAVAHPSDEYTVDGGWYGKFTTNWKGKRYSARDGNGGTVFYSSSWGEFSYAALTCWTGSTGKKVNCGIIEGPGRIYVAPYCPDPSVGGSGAIRVKFIPIDD